MDLKEICKKYFEFFSSKDLKGLESLFSSNIVLCDWEVSATGIKEVLEANKKIFNSVDRVEVIPVNIYLDGHVVICEIEILINELNTIKVVDIITFNNYSKIISIRAFKG